MYIRRDSYSLKGRLASVYSTSLILLNISLRSFVLTQSLVQYLLYLLTIIHASIIIIIIIISSLNN